MSVIKQIVLVLASHWLSLVQSHCKYKHAPVTSLHQFCCCVYFVNKILIKINIFMD